MARVLEGTRVLELGTFITGPCAGMLLADLGADVVKIEQPGKGDPFRSYEGKLYSPQFRAYNARKRSLTLDLKAAQARDVLERLVSEADVLIENYRPGVLASLGYGWERLHELNPRLIYCSITGFGSAGPYVDRPCYDAVAQALSGYLSQSVDPEDPHVVGPALADAVSGMYAAYGILGALVERGRTGTGRHVEVAMLDSLIAFGTAPFAGYFATGKVPGPSSRPRVSQSYALPCADGKLVALHLAAVDKFFQSLTVAIGRTELATDARFTSSKLRAANYEALTAELQGVFRQQPRAHWLAQLTEHDVPHAPVATLDEVCADPQVQFNGVFQKMSHPTHGDVMNVRRPVLYDGDRDAGAVPPPTLGEHSESILRELGYSEETIKAMTRDGVI
jgi:crotonobetainyl-CoA:carnitine CoA-transferase CaiB-like acyl-CoA transferase